MPAWTRGDRLRKARQVAGLTTRELAEQIGVSQKTITDAEGDKRPTVRRPVLIAYAMVSGVSLGWLETGRTPAGPMPDGGLEVMRARRDSNPQPSDPKVGPLLGRVRTAA